MRAMQEQQHQAEIQQAVVNRLAEIQTLDPAQVERAEKAKTLAGELLKQQSRPTSPRAGRRATGCRFPAGRQSAS
jgi:hypothetical protein